MSGTICQLTPDGLMMIHSVQRLLQEAAVTFAERPAFSLQHQTVSYRALDQLSDQLAAYLQSELRLQQGDRVAIALPNVLQFPIAFFGVLKAGLVAVPLNPLLRQAELVHQLNDSGARVLIAEAGSTVLHVTERDTLLEQVLEVCKKGRPTLLRRLSSWARDLFADVVRDRTALPVRSFRRALSQGRQYRVRVAANQPNDIAVIQYTSGTTGVAKGVVLTHGNLLANAAQISERLAGVVVSGQETLLAPLPLYHIYSLMLQCLVMVKAGGHMVLVADPRNLEASISALKMFQPTLFAGLNRLFIGLCRHPAFIQLDFSPLKITFSGGAALTQSAAELWQSITGSSIMEGYGLAEASPVVATNLPFQQMLGSVGYPVAETDVRIVDEEGRQLSCGEAGELWVKGPQVMQGYWNRPLETAQVLQDGWLKTGDIARIAKAGAIDIVERKKDLINVSGFSVYPNELERVISCHPDILECAAVGVPDDSTGEQIKLFVVTHNPRLTIRDIREYCRERLTSYKVPRVVEFRESLPHNSVGKVLRRQLREETLRERQIKSINRSN